MSWKQSDCVRRKVTNVMKHLAEEREIPNRGGQQLGHGTSRIVGSTGEVIVEDYLDEFCTGFDGKRHDLDFGEHKVEVKTMSTEDEPREKYGSDIGYHVQVRRETKNDPDWDIIVFVNLPESRKYGVISGWAYRKEFDAYKVPLDKGTPNGRIKELRENNWGYPYSKMRPPSELRELLEKENNGKDLAWLDQFRETKPDFSKVSLKPKTDSMEMIKDVDIGDPDEKGDFSNI